MGTTKFSYSSLPEFSFLLTKTSMVIPRPSPPRTFTVSRNHWLKKTWDKFISGLLAFSTIESLLYVSYRERGFAMNTLDIPVWCVFFLDFALCFVTDYEDKDGKEVTSFKRIAKRYLKGWFAIDLIALCPLMFFGYSLYEHYFQLLRILKIKRSLDLIDDSWVFAVAFFLFGSGNIDRVIQLKTVTRYTVLVLRQLIIVLMFTFCTGAVFFWYSQLIRPDVHSYFEDEFIDQRPGDLQRPLNSWYFAVTTLATIGYGDLVPANAEERLFVIIMILIGLGVFSIIVGEFNGVVSEIDAIRHNKYQLNELTEWLNECEARSGKIPHKLRHTILAYYEHYWKQDRLGTLAVRWWSCSTIDSLTTSPDPLFAALPRKEQHMVLQVLFDDVFRRYSRLFISGNGLRYDLALHLQPRFYYSKEVILEEGEVPTEVVILLSGVVICGLQSTLRFIDLVSFTNRGVVGDLQVLTKSICPVSYRVHEFSKVRAFAIPSKPFDRILTEKYPQFRKQLLAIAWQRFEIARRALFAYEHGVAINSISLHSVRSPSAVVEQAKQAEMEQRCEELKAELQRLRTRRKAAKSEYLTKKNLLLEQVSQRLGDLTRLAQAAKVR